ncbi:glycosyltransferase family 2 protein [Deinococcus carri]
MTKPLYQVVLATYNGSAYLEQQIVSILNQLGDGELLVHDDGSSDGTGDILQKWSHLDHRIRILDAPSYGNARANFSYLLSETTSPYVFLSDQDDIWLHNKIEELLRIIRNGESQYGSSVPILVHSDLVLVDGIGETIAPSMWRYQNLNPEWCQSLNLLLAQNVVVGCTTLVNRALIREALPIPSMATMHDHWLALVACISGRIFYTKKPTVLYRQHSGNAVGAKEISIVSRMRKMVELLSGKSYPEKQVREMGQMYATASALAAIYPAGEVGRKLRHFALLERCSTVERIKIIFSERFFMNGVISNITWILMPRKYAYRATIFLAAIFKRRNNA